MSFLGKKSMLNWIMVSLFIVFAAIQWNDPDPLKWMCLYGAMAIFIILYQLGYQIKSLFAISAIIFLVYGLFLFPSLLQWIQSGMPSLAGEMKAESPEIEDMRELGGVIIVFLTSVFYWVKSK